MKLLCSLALALLSFPAFAAVTVSAPLNGSTVTSPFQLTASASPCQGQRITAMGYSFDHQQTVAVRANALSVTLSAAAGAHILKVKSWGNGGALCSVAATFTITDATISAPVIPTNAVVYKALQAETNWRATFDNATSGSANGTMAVVASPSLSGTSRQFSTQYSGYGGERYNVKAGTDSAPSHFVYDANLYMASPATGIANVEMDINQVQTDGTTVILAFQCNGWSHTWDYGENGGTVSSPHSHWLHSTQVCDPQQWATDTWHHVQIESSRDDSGNVTYEAVWFDGIEQPIGITTPSAFGLGWGANLSLNFQIDGATSTAGSSIVYLDNVTLYSW